MPNQNTNKSPKKLWKTPSPSKPSLSRPNLQFADLEANTLEELSIEDLSSVSGGGGKVVDPTLELLFDFDNLNLAPITENPPSFINLNSLPYAWGGTWASFLSSVTPLYSITF